jgi:hypothetical protein
MYSIIFFFLMGLVSPSHSGTTSKHECKKTSTTITTMGDGPGGEVGDNPPKP